ncbi:YigZ family protein [Rothia sp. (in: high G+C Gram-positive bacteria)]|uniref:IMPACT family protein n=1 Tax=Rothia sp. (in: high G+C Gram-positive bacteria) TaxID=1885016 RepID=UPI003217CC93
MTQETRANRYTVLATQAPVQSLLEIKRSEFIGFVQRVESEQEARAFIESVRKRYHDARHVCSAFVIGADRDVQRSSDDGEPAGTAGIPMLQALLARRTEGRDGAETTDLSDIVAVVVRYFGGIKLGAGGLVRAYTESVVQVLDAAPLTPRERLRLGALDVGHHEAGRLENDLRSLGYTVLGTDYLADGARLTLGVFDQDATRTTTEEQLASLTAGSTTIHWRGSSWVDLS